MRKTWKWATLLAFFPVTGLAAEPVETPADEVRETWDEDGRLVVSLQLKDGMLVAEARPRYDEKGRLVERTTTHPGKGMTIERFSYDPSGQLLVREVLEDGVSTVREERTYEKGRPTKVSLRDAEGLRVTTTTYDDRGAILQVETRDEEGHLLSRQIADRSAPRVVVPVVVSLSAGLATVSDVESTSITGGFSISRKPTPEQYKRDPFEFGAKASYTRATLAGELFTDQLDAGISFDYNNFAGPLTLFLFSTFSRNPAANLDVDLLAAPVGAKVDLLALPVFDLDLSFAPVWNYRSIAVEAGGDCNGTTLDEDGHCIYSLFRGSFRLRANLKTSLVELSETAEYLPTLNPMETTARSALVDEAVLRNTFALTLQFNKVFSLTESVYVARDPLLSTQEDCAANPDSLLCQNLSLQTGTTLSVSRSF